MSRHRPDIRCAIYTRKSSEEGLEQDFNSLHAQREACEAYIRSQAAEGWWILPEAFDDGGQSGGTLDRPALDALLDAVRRRRIDVIVIYKIDRLTRSLTDFARLAELFDEHGVSFVSVTQQFNTTTSMGRLMLNVLLSFAQFEREVTGERIRDKIAASKQKGMWMGGLPPLGYEVRDRSLVINEPDAETARLIFRLYLELGSVTRLEAELERRGIRTRIRTLSTGRQVGGRPIRKNILYRMLSNPLYIGRIRHKDQTYPGNHAAIIDTETWEAVQTLLATNTQGPRKRRMRGVHEIGMLSGLLVDDKGTRFVLNHANKNGRRYRYYVENRPQGNGSEKFDRPRRIPAKELDRVVRQGVRDLIDDPMRLIEMLGLATSDETALALSGAERLKQTRDQCFAETWQEAILPSIRHILFRSDGLTLQFDARALRAQLGLPSLSGDGEWADIVEFRISVRIRNRGSQMKLIVDGSEKNREPEFDQTLIKAVARAHDWFEQLTTGEAKSINAIAKAEGVTRSYVTRMIRLAFVPPDTVEKILAGSPGIDEALNHDNPMIWPK